MTKTDLIAQVAANTEMSKKSAELAVNAAFEALGKAMAEGEKITISGFGTFEIRERAERQGINPRTREPCKFDLCRRGRSWFRRFLLSLSVKACRLCTSRTRAE